MTIKMKDNKILEAKRHKVLQTQERHEFVEGWMDSKNAFVSGFF
jgi:hypothetical protein